MIIGPKYKIARRLGAPVFEKTQTAKFNLRESQRKVRGGFKRPKTDYGLQMIEKQKARYTYALTEKQFSNYVKKAIAKKGLSSTLLLENLEMRLDNTVYRIGFGSTRLFARQLVSHGHIAVNGKRVTIPSFKVSVGDKITIRAGSLKKKVFESIDEKLKNNKVPSWIVFDPAKKEAEIQGTPKPEHADVLFDFAQVLEFYSR
ncbi:30S ribosomal protein S4 [Candidatus Parcubacteria bacterium]|nr:30S ribosomal protein S4 [Candidatus Parcubacteria bacterium]